MGNAIEILVDANLGYTLDDVRRVMLAYEYLKIGCSTCLVPEGGESAKLIFITGAALRSRTS